MNIVCIGGGPAGLYLAILMKKADPGHHITVLERNRPDDTFGFGVVFSDQTLSYLREADAESHAAITARFAHWDDIAIHYQGELITSTGHGFCGLSRQALLAILQQRCQELGVELRFEQECPPEELDRWLTADLVLGTDGGNSTVRSRYAAEFGPQIDQRPNRFVWLGTTFPFDAFTFYFKKKCARAVARARLSLCRRCAGGRAAEHLHRRVYRRDVSALRPCGRGRGGDARLL